MLGKTVLEWCVSKFIFNKKIQNIVLVINKEQRKHLNNLKLEKKIIITVGGKTRHNSVVNGLKALKPQSPDYVLIHDGARPLVALSTIDEVIKKLSIKNAVVPVIPVNDSLKHITNNYINKTIEKTDIYAVQTPQGFNYKDICNIYKRQTTNDNKDDSEVFEKFGNKVYTIKGDPQNIKITQKEDMNIVYNSLKSNMLTKVGIGYDVHKFTKGKYVKIFGIKIPYTHSLLGHSDADVGIHSLMDSILGALAKGDIGHHFPSNEKKWKNANSSNLLKKVFEILNNMNGLIVHTDTNIICEKPIIKKYIPKMQLHISKILKLNIDSVSIKATTTEGLGYLGRKEGIAAQTITTIKLYK